MSATQELPIEAIRPEFEAVLGQGSLLIEAEPGAGKSTRVPLWLMESMADHGQVWLVQPRVLPCMALARRLASQLNQQVGQAVGYQVPFDRSETDSTRLLAMTPGILIQRLLGEPELPGVAAIILDEIHERSVQQDTAWALLQEALVLREDLQLLLMSATPDTLLRQQVTHALYSPGRCFPVSVEYLAPKAREPLAEHLVRALNSCPDWQNQCVLAFLPGWREITRARAAVENTFPGHTILALHSQVEAREQMAALDPASGPRVILATNIAETSLTIADVTLVLDSGLAREPDFQHKTGTQRLTTRRISAASAEQRKGRAGRVQAGHCLRLWAQSEALPPQSLPEIRRADYLPLALQAAHWGTKALALPWLQQPNSLGLETAEAMLRRWGLLTDEGQVSDLGRQVSKLGTHPRIAALLLHSAAHIHKHSWLPLVALALHFDLALESDLSTWLATAEQQCQRDKRWRKLLQRWQRVLGGKWTVSPILTPVSPTLTEILLRVLVERVGCATGAGRFRLNSGVSVKLSNSSDWVLVIQITDIGKQYTGLGLDLNLSEDQVRTLAEPEIDIIEDGRGDKRRWCLLTRYCLGGKEIDRKKSDIPPADVRRAVIREVERRGLASVAWSDNALSLLCRARLAKQYGYIEGPELTMSALEAAMVDWLEPFLSAQPQLEQLPLAQGLAFYVGFEQVAKLDSVLPPVVTLPSGRHVTVNYCATNTQIILSDDYEVASPKIAGKLQEFFGAETVGDFAVPLSIELLSPAGKPLAITRDLSFFWREVYPDVRREMRGRYVKHPWPEDPLAHSATALTNKRLKQ